MSIFINIGIAYFHEGNQFTCIPIQAQVIILTLLTVGFSILYIFSNSNSFAILIILI